MSVRRLTGFAVWMLLLAGFSTAAAAHVTTTGLAVIAADGSDIRYRLTVVPAELPEPAAELLHRAIDGSRDDAERVAAQAREAVAVRVDGADCRPGRIAVQDIGAGKALLDMTLHCPAPPGRLDIEEHWAKLFGEHYQTIATISSVAGSSPTGAGEHLIGPDSPLVSVDFGAPAPGSFAAFVGLGVMHILTGYDHLLFLFALLSGVVSFWRVLGIASMFTLAHSITLSLAVLGLVHAPAFIVEPMIAASIVWVAIENIAGVGRSSRRFGVAFAFGLVHGLGFADALAPLSLSGWSLLRALGGFNIGVELGQAIAISILLPCMLGLSRVIRAGLVYRTASVAVAIVGAYWFVERIYSG